MSPPLWYFAYGSNMSRAVFVARRGLQPSGATWGWIDGYRLCFDLPVGPGERGVANVVTASGVRTCGVLYRITPEEGEHLDRTEGVPGGYYRRMSIEAATDSGKRLEVFTYQSEFTSPARKPSPRYMGLLLDGAFEHGLPADYIAFLRGFALARDERPEHQQR